MNYIIMKKQKQKSSLILQLTLEKARKLGFKKVFITCDADNIASVKINGIEVGLSYTAPFAPLSGYINASIIIQLLTAVIPAYAVNNDHESRLGPKLRARSTLTRVTNAWRGLLQWNEPA